MVAIDTRSQILSAAMELFAKGGYEKTTMRNIAERVGIRSSSIYYFFNSKEDILDTLFSEFESNFFKYRNEPEDILKAAESNPLSEVLSMIFYKFGSAAECDRIIAVSRIVLSLQYENMKAQKLYQKIMVEDAINYGIEVLEGLCAMGKIREIDVKWFAFILHSFAISLFEKSLQHMTTHIEGNGEYEYGIQYICSEFAEFLKVE